MSREWKPGDVASVTLFDGEEVRAIRVDRCPMCNLIGDEPHWHCGSEHGGNLPLTKDSDARPLVVIDPEDSEQVERLMEQFDYFALPVSAHLVDRMQKALRDVANPPKPEEPTGLGAVVAIASGRKYVRAGDGWLPETVTSPFRNPIDYDDIAAVRVLSPGVDA